MSYLCKAASLGVASVFLMFITGCTRFDLLNATVPSRGYICTADVPYGTSDMQKLDVYRPKGIAAPMPVVIFFYGGHWQEGSKADYRFVAQAMTSRGFMAVLPDYRKYPEVTFPAFVQDGASAVRWVKEHAAEFGADPNRIYLMGHSAGAHIAAMLTFDERYLKAVGLDRSAIRATAALSGPYDFVPSPGDRGVFNMQPADTVPDPSIEPIHFADGKNPPILLVHGLKDQTVEPGNAQRLADRIHAVGGEVQLITYPERAHVGIVLSLAWSFRWLATVQNDVATFFNEH